MGEDSGFFFRAFESDFFTIIDQMNPVLLPRPVETKQKALIFVACLSQGFFATQAFSDRFQLLQKMEIS